MNTSKRRQVARNARQDWRRGFLENPDNAHYKKHEFACNTWVKFGGDIETRIKEEQNLHMGKSKRELRRERRGVIVRAKNEKLWEEILKFRAKHKDSLAKKAARAAGRIAAKFTSYRRQQG